VTGPTAPEPPGDGAAALSITDLEVRYGEAVALHGLTMAVPPGSRVAIVGRNGAGKSTLLNTIAGVVPAREGTIGWAGKDITRWPVHRRVAAGISLVPEGRRTFAPLTVAQNLKAGAFTARARLAERTAEVWELFPALRERDKQAASQLSGGESQMLAIGQALMAGPQLLLLDEPSMGLAPLAVRRVLDTVRRLADGGLSVVLVEQSVPLATDFADEVFALAEGRLIPIASQHMTIDADLLRDAYFGERS
jgi:branched-chain amino acid transport system ATP-binding protein